MLVASLMLGGLLPIDARTREHWAPSGAFRMPVGDPYQVYEDRPRTPGPFFIVRGVAWEGERASHQGADLGSGSAGALVRAAASGLVISVLDHGEHGGYGTHVVLAHRLPEGVLAYTVYAHLREYSPRVKPGQCVQAGQVLGRVGETGHATGPHLHFEVRIAGDPSERWEFARVEDPLAFVDTRLPTHRADTTGVEACLEWAECAALIPLGARAEDELTRGAWWRMLAAGVRGPALDPALSPLDLRDSLVAARVLDRDPRLTPPTASGPMEWPEMTRDLGRVRTLGMRSGASPLRRGRQRAACEEWLGTAMPAANLAALGARTDRPSVGEAVMALADLAGPTPEPAKAVPVKKPPLGTGKVALGPPAPAGAARGHRDSLATHAKHVAAHDSLAGHPKHAAAHDSLAAHPKHAAAHDSLAAHPKHAATHATGDSSGTHPTHAKGAGHAHADSSRATTPAARHTAAAADTAG